jgi:hypothetical protein
MEFGREEKDLYNTEFIKIKSNHMHACLGLQKGRTKSLDF